MLEEFLHGICDTLLLFFILSLVIFIVDGEIFDTELTMLCIYNTRLSSSSFDLSCIETSTVLRFFVKFFYKELRISDSFGFTSPP